MNPSAELFVDLENLKRNLEADSRTYTNARPFPHLVIDNFLVDQVATNALASFPPPNDNRWISYKYFNKHLSEISDRDNIPEPLSKVMNYLNSRPFLDWLESITGFSELIPDSALEVGGINFSPRGGHLNVHADFTTHPTQSNLRRRVNILLYLNKDWHEEYNGHLELWSKRMEMKIDAIAPLFNRCVIFSTEKDCLHGYPKPINCPEGDGRKSINLYYFTREGKDSSDYATLFKPATNTYRDRIWISLENFALKQYHLILAKWKINDKKWLRFFKTKSGNV